MFKRVTTVAVVVLILLPLNAQQWKLKRVEGIFGIGTTNVYSDLGGAPNATSLLFIKDITFRSTRPSLYAGVRYRVNPRTSVKLNFIYGYSKTSDYTGSRNELRGFSSVTDLFEISGHYEYYLLPEFRFMRSAAMFNRRGMINDYSRLGFYVFSGIAATMYWPHLTVEPRQGDEYKNNFGFTGAVPVGAGVKFIISDKWMLGYEIGYRQSFTDFMDGFKSPWSKRWDGYWISSINLIYRIPTSRRGIPIFLDPAWKRARF
jgi:opacity protein-like surface antigen